MTPEELLSAGLTAYGLSTDAVGPLMQFAGLLLERNKVMNLTAITAPEDVVTLHFLDCAALLTAADFTGKRVVDVGTGAGFPGVPLKLAGPEFSLTLLDSLGKRIDFLQEICDTIPLKETVCVKARAEEFAQTHREAFDLATSRAVAALPVLCELSLPLLRVGGTFLAMKGCDSDVELANARRAIGQLGGRVAFVRDYVIPGTDTAHRIIGIEKVRPTPRPYPRPFAKIKKCPL
jgi:16S rRNA (guanine527-N7)-methyltransferase